MSRRNLFAYAPNEVLTVIEFRGINAVRPGPVPTILINVVLAEHILEYSKWGSGRLDWNKIFMRVSMVLRPADTRTKR